MAENKTNGGKTASSKAVTFGDESVESTETAPVETVEETPDAEPETETAPEADEASETDAPKTWDAYEAKLRDDLAGFIVGRQIESAVRYAKNAWDAAKAS